MTTLPDRETAQVLALRAVEWLLRDPYRSGRFEASTGMPLLALKEQLDDDATLAAVLEYLLGDESLLLSFVADMDIEADMPRLSWMRLSGTRDAW
ncbi:DUF3572 family protein [Thermopetrobacter sp. TC1]|uniref:DUF3572 family protein n=1 Tax=Thermopetrobacter sp. TC1 TaxID=1495045 RepID=UPI000691FE18|nr:DUF3572 family protein [Thermopetrobacter sp. TC1]